MDGILKSKCQCVHFDIQLFSGRRLSEQTQTSFIYEIIIRNMWLFVTVNNEYINKHTMVVNEVQSIISLAMLIIEAH